MRSGRMKNATNKINHFVYVIDMSWSMKENGKAEAVVKVVDEEIAHLARRSQELKQETRVSIYLFDDKVCCAIWDMDVLRLPSIAELYDPDNATALIDASMIAIEDLSHTPQKYGDHAFFTRRDAASASGWSGETPSLPATDAA